MMSWIAHHEQFIADIIPHNNAHLKRNSNESLN